MIDPFEQHPDGCRYIQICLPDDPIDRFVKLINYRISCLKRNYGEDYYGDGMNSKGLRNAIEFNEKILRQVKDVCLYANYYLD